MKNRILVLSMIFIILFSNLSFGISNYEGKIKSYLLADLESGEIVDSFNIDIPVEIASISKLLSYYVIMDEIDRGNINYNDVIVIDKDIASITGSSYKLKVGEEFTVEKLLSASIVISGNDAVYAIAKHIASTEENFVKLMKKKANDLGLKNSEIYNSSGLPVNNEGLQNKMTTRELFVMVKSLLENHPEVLELSKIPFISEPSRDFFQINTNPLLRTVEGVDGLKTGYTGKAGYCLVSTIKIEGEVRKTEDIRLIGIVMGANNFDDRTDISKELIQYGIDNYEKRIILHNELPIDKLDFSWGDPSIIDIYPEESLSMFIKKDTDIKLDIKLDESKLPLSEHTNLGKVTVIEDNKPIFSTNLINKEKVEKTSILTLIYKFYANLFIMEEAIFK